MDQSAYWWDLDFGLLIDVYIVLIKTTFLDQFDCKLMERQLRQDTSIKARYVDMFQTGVIFLHAWTM